MPYYWVSLYPCFIFIDISNYFFMSSREEHRFNIGPHNIRHGIANNTTLLHISKVNQVKNE